MNADAKRQAKTKAKTKGTKQRDSAAATTIPEVIRTAKAKKRQGFWLPQPEAHDYPAARSYLLLICPEQEAEALVERLRTAEMTSFKAKDIFRASALPLLGLSNFHVKRNRKKIVGGQGLSPLLLVSDPKLGKLIIADGYHRLCAVYGYDEDSDVPCKITCR